MAVSLPTVYSPPPAQQWKQQAASAAVFCTSGAGQSVGGQGHAVMHAAAACPTAPPPLLHCHRTVLVHSRAHVEAAVLRGGHVHRIAAPRRPALQRMLHSHSKQTALCTALGRSGPSPSPPPPRRTCGRAPAVPSQMGGPPTTGGRHWVRSRLRPGAWSAGGLADGRAGEPSVLQSRAAVPWRGAGQCHPYRHYPPLTAAVMSSLVMGESHSPGWRSTGGAGMGAAAVCGPAAAAATVFRRRQQRSLPLLL